MTMDNNLVLDAGQTLTNEAQTTAINVEGGRLAVLNLKLGTLAATGDGLKVRLQYKPDGTNWYTCPGGIFETIDGADDSKLLRSPVFIPKNDTKGELTPVRLEYELTENGTESFVITKAWLSPLFSSTPPELAMDDAQDTGWYIDMPKTAIALL